MRVVLKDGAPRRLSTVEISISKYANTLEIGVIGVDPAPIVLEFYDGNLTLRAYDANGNQSVSKLINITPTPTAFTPDPAVRPEQDEFSACQTVAEPVVAKTIALAPVQPDSLKAVREQAAAVNPPFIPTGNEPQVSSEPEFDEAAFDACSD